MAEGVALHELVERDGRAVDYRVLDVNPSFERLTGLAADHSRDGWPASSMGPNAPFLERYAQVATSGEPQVLGAYFAPTQRHVRITAVSPGPGRFVTIIEDVTELRRAAAEIKRAAEGLRSAADERRRLIERSRPLPRSCALKAHSSRRARRRRPRPTSRRPRSSPSASPLPRP